MNNKVYSIDDLLHKPLCMMDGEEFAFLMSNLSLISKQKEEFVMPAKRYAYGINGIAETFHCSIPTANRIKKSGIIDDAISQIERQIVLDVDLALQLVSKNKDKL
jgi:hypothetical protein